MATRTNSRSKKSSSIRGGARTIARGNTRSRRMASMNGEVRNPRPSSRTTQKGGISSRLSSPTSSKLMTKVRRAVRSVARKSA